MTIFVLEKLIKEEKLNELKELITQIKGSQLEKEFQRQYGTANLSNAIEHLIKKSTNKEVFQISFDLGLEYLEDRNLGQLIMNTILFQKNDYYHYHYIKESMDGSRFEQIQKSSFLNISSAFDAFPNPYFYTWIKLVEPEQESLLNHIRASILDGRMNMDYLDSYLSKVEVERKEGLIYECLAWLCVGKTNTDKLCHLFNLILPEINKPLLLDKLKHTINLAEAKDLKLQTDNLERFGEVLAGHRQGNVSVLLQLVNSYNLNTCLNEHLGDTEKKSTYKSSKI